MSEHETTSEKAEIDFERVEELAEKIANIFEGEQIFDAISALERVVVNIIVNNCHNKQAAYTVIDVMTTNMSIILDEMDDNGMAVWHNASRNN